jgi:hypothetical protein
MTWKTIDTAKRNGTIVVGRCDRYCALVRFNGYEWEQVDRSGEDMGIGFYPTHYFELPEPPKE